MKLSKSMCVLFTGLGLLTAVIVFQMYRFSMSGFTDSKKDGTAPPAPTPATAPEPLSFGANLGFVFGGLCAGAFLAYLVTSRKG